jgi:thiol-disulfide isomerase/thioredoxin
MKKVLFSALLLVAGVAQVVCAKNDTQPVKDNGYSAYRVKVHFTDMHDSMVFLAHYYGKPLPTIYKRDSAKLDKNGYAVIQSSDTDFVGGIYIILLSDRKSYFEFLLDKGNDISITATASELPQSLKFKNSPENERFLDYQAFAKKYSEMQDGYRKKLAAAKTADDTAAVRKEASKTSKDLINYRKDYVQKYPGTLLSAIFRALEVPQVPEGDHFLEDGKTKDSTFAYTYYKSHFWDGFDFHDDRLIHTPLFDSKLDEYMNKEVLPWPDSVEHEADMLLAKARGSKDIFKYSLWWLTRYAENSKVMGMDEVFVYLVENYYMKGDAFWLTNEELQKYEDRAQKIAPNVIGNIAPDIKVPSVINKGETPDMHDIKAKYTLIVFYSPSCGHCQHEMPLLDSTYEAVLKDKGVKVYTVATEGDEKAITDFLVKLKVDKKWTNTWDPDHIGDWRNKFDVYSTPTIYLLDEKKKIIGKRIDHANVASLIEATEKKLKDKESKGKVGKK